MELLKINRALLSRLGARIMRSLKRATEPGNSWQRNENGWQCISWELLTLGTLLLCSNIFLISVSRRGGTNRCSLPWSSWWLILIVYLIGLRDLIGKTYLNVSCGKEIGRKSEIKRARTGETGGMERCENTSRGCTDKILWHNQGFDPSMDSKFERIGDEMWWKLGIRKKWPTFSMQRIFTQALSCLRPAYLLL